MSEAVGVLNVVGGMALGGAERMAVDLANRAHGADFRCALLSTRGGGPLQSQVREGIPVLALDRTARWDPRSFARFREFVRGQRVRIIHSHGPGPLQYVTAALAMGTMGCRHVHHIHRARSAADRPPDLPTRLSLLWKTDAVIGVCGSTCDWVRRWFPRARFRTYLLRNGVETGRFGAAAVSPAQLRESLGLPDKAVLVAMVANFRPEKDHLTALRALARLPEGDPIHLLLVGGEAAGEPECFKSVLRAVDELKVKHRVRFLGPRDDIPLLLGACDAGLLTSQRESGPLAILEYMAAGLPFVATRVGEIGWAIPEGAGGFFRPAGDAEGLAAALHRLGQMLPAERGQLGARGRALVEREFDQDRTVDRLARIYAQVLRC